MISYRGRAENIVYEISKPTKWGFRSYELTDLNKGFTYYFKLLNDNEIDEYYKDDKNGEMFNFVIEFLKCLSNYNNSKVKYILATKGLYTNEKLLELDDIYFVGAIRKNKLKKYENLLEEIPKKTFQYYYKKTKDKISILTKFNDSKLMFIISNFIDSPKNVKKRDGIKKKRIF